MTAFHIALGVALIAVNARRRRCTARWCWWRHRRRARVLAAAADRAGARDGRGASTAAILLLHGPELPELHLIYGLVPLGVSFIAEQLRLAAADTVLAQRGLEGRADVEKLPEREQRELVRRRSCAGRWA